MTAPAAPPQALAPPPPAPSRRALARSPWLPAAAAFLAALLTYAVTLQGTYVYDDTFIVRDDPRLHDPSRWGEYWTDTFFPGGVTRLYRPLVSLSYAVQWQLHGDRPWAFHLVNVLSHALVAAGVAEIARRLCGRRAALAAGLLFAVHPVHVECVAGLVGRSELWCTGGIVAAVLLMCSPRGLTGGRVAGIIACLLFAFGSKEQAILLPFFLWALVFAGIWRAANPPERKRGKVLALALCWLTAGYIIAREATPMKFSWDRAMLDWSAQPLIRASAGERWLIVADVLGRYAELMLFPARLALDYGYRVTSYRGSWSDLHVYAGLATAIAGVALLALAWRRRWGVVVWCLLCAGLAYAMIGNLTLPIGTIMAERLLYLPSVFLLVLAGYALARLPLRVYAILLALLVIAGGARSFAYARLWSDRLTLYQQQVRAQPKSIAVHHLLAQELMERGDVAGAVQVLEDTARLAPDYWGTPFFAAKLLMVHGHYDAAEQWVLRSARIEGNDPTAVWFLRTDIARRRAAATQPTTAS